MGGGRDLAALEERRRNTPESWPVPSQHKPADSLSLLLQGERKKEGEKEKKKEVPYHR